MDAAYHENGLQRSENAEGEQFLNSPQPAPISVDSDSTIDSDSGNDEQTDLMLAVLRLFKKDKKSKKSKKTSKSSSKSKHAAAALLSGGSVKKQKQLLGVLSEALAGIDGCDGSADVEPSEPSTKRLRTNYSQAMPALMHPSAATTQTETFPSNMDTSGAGGAGRFVEGGEDRFLHSFMDQLPRIEDHLDAMIADVEHTGVPAPTGAFAASVDDRQWDTASSSGFDDAAAAASAPAPVDASARKRKFSECEMTGVVGGNTPTIDEPATSLHSEGRWQGESQVQHQQQRTLLLPQISTPGPVIVTSRQLQQQSATKLPLLSLPAICLATSNSLNRSAGSSVAGAAGSCAPPPPPPAAPIRFMSASPDATAQATQALGNLMAEQPLGFPLNFEFAAHSSGEDTGFGFDDVGGDDVDEWMPRSRGRKDVGQQQLQGGQGGAGSRIKARSMAERQRRERISEGLQKLRLAVRGHGDTATMLDNAVAYVQQMQRRLTSLETSMLLHQAQCGNISQGGSAAGSPSMNHRSLHSNGFRNHSQLPSLFSVDV